MALTERLSIVLETTGAGAAARDFQKVAASAEGLGGKMKAVGGQMKGTLAGAVPALAAAAGAGLVAFAANAVQAFQDGALAALNLQRAIGGTIEDASRLVAAFDDMGISAEVGTKAMFQMARRVGESSEKLRGHGIVVARDAQGNANLTQTLLNVASAYNATSDPAKRAQILMDTFGKSGQAMIPILEQDAEGIRALFAEAAKSGQVFSPEDAKTAEDLRIAVDGLHDAMGELSLTAGRELTPAVTGLTNAAKDSIPWLSRIAGFGAWLFGLDGSFEDTADSASTLARQLKEGADAAALDADKIAELEKVTLAASSAQRSLAAAGRAVDTAERGLAEARKEYNKLLKEGAVDEEKVADARRSLADATRSLGSAQRNLRERQEEYNEALTYFQAVGGDTAYDKLQDASDNLADANDGVASATERQQDAAAELKKAQAGDPEFNDKLAKAKQGVADAEQSLSDAQFNAAQQAYALSEALDAQSESLEANAGQVAAVRSEWAELLALKPELVPFLQGPMAALGGAAVPSAGGGLLSPTPTAGNLSPVTNNNQQVTVNVSGPAADPETLARNIVWNLN
jgi:hypothetical protein